MDRYQQQATLLKAIGHPVRLRIVDLLRMEPECVCHLSAALGKPQPYVSQQLAILRNAGVIVDERGGANIFYRLADADVKRQVEAVWGPDLPASTRMVVGCNCPKCADGCGGKA
jgi:ArsR family transcriptional regulator